MPVVNGKWVAPDKAWGGMEFNLKTAHGRREPMYVVKDIRKLLDNDVYTLKLGRAMAMDIEQAAVEMTGSANDALKELKATLDKFRSTIANDLTAIKSASTKVQSETLQMKQEYLAAQAVLTTPDFERAIANAERLAVALSAIQALNETKVSVAVFSGRDTDGAK